MKTRISIIIAALILVSFSSIFAQPYTIEGNTGTDVVTLTWTDGTLQTTTSDGSGDYTITVSDGWAGTIVPSKVGYTFIPSELDYSTTPVTSNLTGQDFAANINSYTISGNVGVSGATISFTGGTPVISNSSGDYTLTVDHGFSGTVTPSLTVYTFSPTSRSYSTTPVTSNLTGQDFTAIITIGVSVSPFGSGTISGLNAQGKYNYNETIDITAIAEIGYTFVNWTENGSVVSNSANYTFPAKNNRTLVANFSLNKYQILTISAPPEGGITSGGGTFDHGTNVILVATPATGYNFTSWTENGTVVSNDSSFTFPAVAARTLTANFTKKKYNVTLSVKPLGSGTTVGTGNYDHGSMVKIEAKPNIGWSFENWTENDLILSSDSSFTFVVLNERNITANFKKKIYSVAIVSKPNEGGNTTGVGNYEHGTSVNITATPNIGWKFNNWTEGEQIITIDSAYTFTITGNRSFTANFSKKTYLISTSSIPNEGGVTRGDSTYTHGDNVTLIAIPNSDLGYEFVSWNENGLIVTTNSSYSFTATNNRALVANFSLKTYTVTLSTNPVDGGTMSGAGDYTHGDSVSITATPSAGWLFANWTEDGVNISDSTTFSFRITSNRNIIANFAHELYSILATPDPLDAGIISGAGTFFFGQTAKLIASSNPGWDFDNWTENGTIVSSNPLYEFIVDGNRTVKANFSKTPFNIICSSMPNEGGTTTGCGISFYGESMLLKAIPNNGWKFISWTESDNIVSESSEYTFTVERDRNLVANFDLIDAIEKIDDFDQIPEKYYLSNAYPNPFNPETNIQFGLPEPSTVNLYIFNVNGQLVTKVMSNVMLPAGNYKSRFNIERNGERLPSGVYFYRIISQSNNSTNNYIKVGKLVLLK